MCGLFGFYSYGNSKCNLSKLTNVLASEASVRGTDATGIAYNHEDKLIIHKEALPASKIIFKVPEDTICMMGHTRHSTQGDKRKNYNNHPFAGKCKNKQFALAHNGILINELELKTQFHLPDTKIETDSYIAVQLLQKKDKLNIENIKHMAENVDCSLAFSILDDKNILWLVRGDNPLSVIHFTKKNIYVYASTDAILYRALAESDLLSELKLGNFEEITIFQGEILKFNPDGRVIRDKFEYTNLSYYNTRWWNYGFSLNSKEKIGKYNKEYLDELKSVASYYGYSPKDIDKLIADGFTYDEIEELFYFCG